MKKHYLTTLLLIAVSCAPARYVQPIPAGHYDATVSLGGPLLTYSDMVIPMPLMSLAGGYGLTEKTTLFGGLHLTALAFEDIQLEAGGLYQLMPQEQYMPGISVSPSANVVLAMRDGAFRVWPALDLNFYWDYYHGNLVYLSSSNWFELSGTRADGADQPHHVIANFELGHVFDGEHWQYATELKYIAAGIDNLPNPVDYHGISGKGTFGVYVGLTRKF